VEARVLATAGMEGKAATATPASIPEVKKLRRFRLEVVIVLFVRSNVLHLMSKMEECSADL
jgi:hypothetical protein